MGLSGVPASVLLVVAVLALVLFTQFSTRPVRASAFIWVALLVARGIAPPGPAAPTTTGITFLVGGLLLSAALGAWRGATMPMWRDDTGRVVRRGNRVTLALWLLTLAVRVVSAVAEHLVDHAAFNPNGLWLGFGVTLAAQHALLLRRASALPASVSSRVDRTAGSGKPR
ncbi:hypothetical protein [Actinokineospora enzanensis]|uniref:hypothetical protein n=1 Tax=Actinokineospora enzanensis TaxID=155975 RepID=UPI00037BAEB0|nr:hypothetical protein [Actinokineospora enzanensis]